MEEEQPVQRQGLKRLREKDRLCDCRELSRARRQKRRMHDNFTRVMRELKQCSYFNFRGVGLQMWYRGVRESWAQVCFLLKTRGPEYKKKPLRVTLQYIETQIRWDLYA